MLEVFLSTNADGEGAERCVTIPTMQRTVPSVLTWHVLLTCPLARAVTLSPLVLRSVRGEVEAQSIDHDPHNALEARRQPAPVGIGAAGIRQVLELFCR